MSRIRLSWMAVILLSLSLIIWLGACTRTVDLTATPRLPPVAAYTQTALSMDNTRIEKSEPTKTVQVDDNLAVTPTASDEVPLYAAVFLAEGELLNVRTAPGVTNDIVGTLPANARDLPTTGKQEDVDGVNWVEIQLPDGVVGWVSGQYLTLQVPAPQFCSDARVGTLLDSLVNAVRNQDGTELARLASPIHGFTFQAHVWGPTVLLDNKEAITVIFTSTVDYEWNISDEGESITGAFKDVILPELENVLLQSHSRHCNSLEQGVAAGVTQDGVYWPYDYRSLNYVSLFRPAPAENEQDWRTWAVGIEYVGDEPFIAVLLQFAY